MLLVINRKGIYGSGKISEQRFLHLRVDGELKPVSTGPGLIDTRNIIELPVGELRISAERKMSAK